MKNMLFSTLLSALLLLASCKKTTNPPPSGGGTVNSATPHSGVLVATRAVMYPFTPYNDTSYNANAYLYNTPQNGWYYYYPVYLSNVVSVLVNGIQLKNQSNVYSDSTGVLQLIDTVKWAVNGNSTITSFTCANSIVWPEYSGYGLIPDTIHIGQAIILNLSGMTNTDSVEINLISGSAMKQTHIMMPNTNFSVTAAATSALPASNYAYIIINMYKFLPLQDLVGKKFLFYNTYTFVKTIVVL